MHEKDTHVHTQKSANIELDGSMRPTATCIYTHVDARVHALTVTRALGLEAYADPQS